MITEADIISKIKELKLDERGCQAYVFAVVDGSREFGLEVKGSIIECSFLSSMLTSAIGAQINSSLDDRETT